MLRGDHFRADPILQQPALCAGCHNHTNPAWGGWGWTGMSTVGAFGGGSIVDNFVTNF
jgi:hypothetical protein